MCCGEDFQLDDFGVMKTVPKFHWNSFRVALKALEDISEGADSPPLVAPYVVAQATERWAEPSPAVGQNWSG